MQLFRNKEIRDQIVLSFGATFALMVLAAVGFGFWAAVFVLLCGVAVLAINIFYLKRRYNRIAELSDVMDRVLHGHDDILIEDGDEGELAILKSQLSKMTAALRDNADQLASDKTRLSDAIADMFHQMRTPITSMAVTLSLLEAEDLSYEKRLELVRTLKKQTEKLHWLTETLLKMSKLDAGSAQFRPEGVSLRALVDKACAPFLIPVELKGIDLDISCDDALINCDLSWTSEALGNLVKNCLEHTPEGGSIKITATDTALFSLIEVQDSGEGFCKEDIPHLFERFYKGKNSSPESIGIGLALSRSIISAQNGTITASNAENGGAKFTVKFYKSVV